MNKKISIELKTLTPITQLVLVTLILISTLFTANQRPVRAAGNFTVNHMFSSYMVLQRDRPVSVFGTGVEGTNITVTFNGQVKTGSVTGGKFLINLNPMSANAT